MNYENFRFIDPPRAEQAIPPSLLSFYEKQGWVAQVKMNGAYNVIFCNNAEKKLIALNRTGGPHKAWKWSDESAEAFRMLPKDGWYVFCAELLHSKGPFIKDTNYIHDVLVYQGQYLIGQPYLKRFPLLRKIFKRSEPHDRYSIINKNTWLANIVHGGFLSLFDSLKGELEEGVVCKDPHAELDLANTSWQIKCRKRTKNFDW